MPPLTTSALTSEVLEDSLLTLDQITTGVTVLALNACRNPEQSVRVRALLSDLLADIQDCEGELGIMELPSCSRVCQVSLPNDAADPPDLKIAIGKGDQIKLDVSPLAFDLASKIVSVLDCGIEDLLEVFEVN